MSSAPPNYVRPRPSHARGTNRNRHRFIPLQLDSEELEELMEVASGEIVDTPHADAPYCAIFRFEDEVLFQWPVQTVHEGEARIIEALTFLHAKIVELRDAPPLVIH
jgi:hypothetical protein